MRETQRRCERWELQLGLEVWIEPAEARQQSSPTR